MTRKLVFAIAAAAAALFLIEGAARLWLTLSSRPGEAADVTAPAVTPQLDVLGEDLPADGQDVPLAVPDAELLWRLRPDTSVTVRNVVYETRTRPITFTVRINADGHRGSPYPRNDAGASPVVVTLGDACTFGLRVGEDDTYPALLQQYLRAHGMPRAVVVNYGVPGYTSFQGRRLLARILARHRPDFVVLAFGTNDLEAAIESDAARAGGFGAVTPRLRAALGRLAMAQVLLGAERNGETRRVSTEEFRDNMVDMVRAAQRSGARVVLLDLVLIGPDLRDTIAATALDEGWPWIDGREVLRDGLADLLAGRRFQAERAEIDRFWEEEVERYRLTHYDEEVYRKLIKDPMWRALLRYLMVEPVHASPLGNLLIAEEVGWRIRLATGP